MNEIYYYTSDLHFNHTNIIKACRRPFSSVEEMNAALVDNWNSRVTDEDTVYILGDVTLAGAEIANEFLTQLKGQKVLIPGNHDTFAYRDDYICPGVEVNRTGMCRVVDPFINKAIILCHYPIAVWRGKGVDSIHFYGHVHNTSKSQFPYLYRIDDMYNVGVDVQGYMPRTANEVIKSRQR